MNLLIEVDSRYLGEQFINSVTSKLLKKIDQTAVESLLLTLITFQ